MFTVTDSAKEELKRIVEARSIEVGRCLRLAVQPAWPGPGDFGIVIDDEKAEDHTIAHRGAKILLLNEQMLPQLDKSILDYKDTPEGARFTLDVY
jgi:Fe-S cluster assembly iron-binding protein IscA